MTAQITETIRYEGQKHAMCSEPLGDYFELSGKTPDFEEMHTACWRAYIGEWEVRGYRLYLIGIKASYSDGSKVTLDSLFPGFSDRVFAHWYSGTVRLPVGEMLDYVHMGYESTYERDVFLEFKKGVLVGKTEPSNTDHE